MEPTPEESRKQSPDKPSSSEPPKTSAEAPSPPESDKAETDTPHLRTCPGCGRSVAEDVRECPHCGLIVSRFLTNPYVGVTPAGETRFQPPVYGASDDITRFVRFAAVLAFIVIGSIFLTKIIASRTAQRTEAGDTAIVDAGQGPPESGGAANLPDTTASTGSTPAASSAGTAASAPSNPIQNPAASLPSSPTSPPTWHKVVKLKGTDFHATASVSIRGAQWRVTWATRPASGGAGRFRVVLRPAEGGSSSTLANAAKAAQGTENLARPGDYYLDVEAPNSFLVFVEEYY